MNIHLAFTVAWRNHIVASVTGDKGLFLQFQDILLVSLARRALNSVVSFSAAAPVPKETGCRLEGDTAQF